MSHGRDVSACGKRFRTIDTPKICVADTIRNLNKLTIFFQHLTILPPLREISDLQTKKKITKKIK